MQFPVVALAGKLVTSDCTSCEAGFPAEGRALELHPIPNHHFLIRALGMPHRPNGASAFHA